MMKSSIAIGLIVIGLVMAGALAAHPTAQAVPVNTFTPRRMVASLSVLLTLIGAVLGGRALARGEDRRGSMIPLILGPIGLIGGAFIVTTAKGGVGTGNGLAGGVVAIVMGLITMSLGGLAFARARRAG